MVGITHHDVLRSSKEKDLHGKKATARYVPLTLTQCHTEALCSTSEKRIYILSPKNGTMYTGWKIIYMA